MPVFEKREKKVPGKDMMSPEYLCCNKYWNNLLDCNHAVPIQQGIVADPVAESQDPGQAHKGNGSASGA